MIEFISTPVIGGFCSAAALTVASTQIKGLLGLNIKGSSFLSIWIEAIRHIQETRLWDAVLGFTAILLLLSLRVSPR
jgi:solute carrier family 26 (sodium-independent sulfate anion transporter), member 11